MRASAAQARRDWTAALLTLVLGGAQSGKSRYGEGLIAKEPPPWTYVATAEALDDEMAQRIAEHRARRAGSWQTVEAPRDLPAALVALPRGAAVLVDCLTLWLSNVLLAGLDIGAETARFDDVLTRMQGRVVLVSNEVGLGIVPEHALGRRFRDLQGVLNQRIAARADQVVLMVAGLPLFVKGQA